MELYIIPVAISLLGSLITWSLYKWGSKVAALEVIYLAVVEVSQTYVADLKAANADGKLTDEEKALARKKAFDKCLEIAKGPALSYIKKQGQVWVETMVEYFVAKLKKS
jgi:hypothetical protein